MATLMVTERARLKDCERAIERGMSTFVEVGKALAEIRDSKLYRDTHKTFQAYVKQRWGHDRNWAYSLIDASGAAENVSHAIQNPNARQAVELAKAPAEKQAEVWEKVTSEGEPTAAKVKAAVQEIVYADDDEPEYTPPKRTTPQPSPIFNKLCELWKQAEPATQTRFRLWIDGECS